MKKPIAATLLPIALVLFACSSQSLSPTPVPAFTLTAIPATTATRLPADAPLPPTETLAVASKWNGIPIMPGAVAGDGDEESYVFTILATPQQVQKYYELELGKLGWQSVAQEEENGSQVLTFTKEASVTLTVSILAKNDKSLVLLVK